MIVRPSMIILRGKKILLLKYNYSGHDVYGLPGGNPEGIETLEDTLVRELKDELNLSVKLDRLALAGEVISPENKKTALHCVFLGQIEDGTPRINPEHTTALDCEWKEVNKLDSLNLYPNVGKYIKNLVLQKHLLPNPYIGKIEQKWF